MQVCRSLRKLIQADSYMQYLLDLEACGYVEPQTPRSDLSYSEKLEVIRSHKLRWSSPQIISPGVYEICTAEGSQSTYNSGVYVRSARISDTMPGATRQLHFYQLPSSNRGTEYKYWLIPDLGVDVHFFAIDPEQDLLVLVELHSTHPEECSYILHLRTISTGEAHPKLPFGRAALAYQSPLTWAPMLSPFFEICGHLLAVMFPSRHGLGSSYIVVWDWISGIELTVSPL